MSTKTEELQRIASQVRRDIIRMVHSAKSGHPGGSLSSTEIMTSLYFNVMKHDPANWKRDAKGTMPSFFPPDTLHRYIIQYLRVPDISTSRNSAR